MEQGPYPFYNQERSKGESPRPERGPEYSPGSAESARQSPETLPTSKTFEQMVQEALEQELKYERDPALRDRANQRATEILAEFQEAKRLRGNGHLPGGADAEADEGLSPELAKQLGVKPDNPPRQSNRSGPIYPGSAMNYGLLDVVMAAVIAILLIIIILLLIF